MTNTIERIEKGEVLHPIYEYADLKATIAAYDMKIATAYHFGGIDSSEMMRLSKQSKPAKKALTELGCLIPLWAEMETLTNDQTGDKQWKQMDVTLTRVLLSANA